MKQVFQVTVMVADGKRSVNFARELVAQSKGWTALYSEDGDLIARVRTANILEICVVSVAPCLV